MFSRQIFWRCCFILLNCHLNTTDAACSFPFNTGTWISTDKGRLPVTSTTISDYTTVPFGRLSYDCYMSSGSQYVARSTTFTQHGNLVRAYICFELYKVNSYQYYYYEGSDQDPTLSNERLKTVSVTATVSITDICDRTVYAAGSYYMLVQDGYFSQAASTCSAPIQGQWSYTFKNSAGVTSCTTDSGADSCTDKKLISFNYTACSEPIMYSADGELNCLYSSSGGSYVYQHVLNLDTTTDERTTYRITCLVLSSEDKTRYVTQHPNNCHASQTSKAVVSPGASMEFTLLERCPTTSTEEKNYTAAIVVGVLVPVLLIIVILIVGYKMHQNYKYYQEHKEVPTPPPNRKFANGEIRNKRMCKSNGVRIDEKTIIHDTPRSIEISIEEKPYRPESTATTGSVRRDSSIILDINPSTRGTMVAESLPEMSETGDYSSDFSDSDADDPKKDAGFDKNADFLKNEEPIKSKVVPQIVIDSLTRDEDNTEFIETGEKDESTQTDDELLQSGNHELIQSGNKTGNNPPDIIVTGPVLPAPTSIPDQNGNATETNEASTKKKIKRKKSASFKKGRPGSSRNSTRQKPDCYGNTDEKLLFGTRINVLRIRPKSKSFRKKKQVDPLITDEDYTSTPPIKEVPETARSNDTVSIPSLPNIETPDNEQKNCEDKNSVDKLIPDETKSENASKSNLKRNESMLRDKIYRVTNRDLGTSKRKKKLPKLRHPLERKGAGTPDKTPDSWFKHKEGSASKSRTNRGQTKVASDSENHVSPEVDVDGNPIPTDPDDTVEQKRPPTQQKPFVNPHTETTEEIFDKIKNMWHFGNKWLGNTYIAGSPR